MLSRVIGLLSMVILARQLSPYDFGLVSITEVLINLIGVIGSAGVIEFLLAYRKRDEAEIYQAVFWFLTIGTLVIAGVFLIALPFWADANHDERIVNLGWYVAGYFLLSQMQAVPKNILSRKLEFKAQVRIQYPFLILMPLGKIGCAYAGLGVYSLVIPTLVLTFFQAFFFFRKAEFVPGLTLYINRWREIFSFSRNMIGTMVLSRVSTEGDKIILGGILGLESLGIYNMAFQLANLYPNNTLTVSNSILSATLPKFADDLALLKSKFYSFLQVLAFFSVPIQTIMALAAGPLITLLYGTQWGAAVLPFQILSVFAILRTLTSSTGSVLNSIGKPHIGFKLVLIYAPLHLAVSYAGSFFGIAGLAAFVVALKLLYTPYEMHIALSHIDSSVREWFQKVKDVLVQNAICAVICIAFIASMFGLISSPIVQFFIVASIYCIAYYALVKIFYSNFLIQVMNKLMAMNPRYASIFKFAFRLN
ncbi:MAG: oligosaccharide flippase family protein [Cyclobacteriaceae bacterium]|nr:oligosaccharide flippase family protein [Cyclobacteriaceae bacterium]